jgi:hypothetical protein
VRKECLDQKSRPEDDIIIPVPAIPKTMEVPSSTGDGIGMEDFVWVSITAPGTKFAADVGGGGGVVVVVSNVDSGSSDRNNPLVMGLLYKECDDGRIINESA